MTICSDCDVLPIVVDDDARYQRAWREVAVRIVSGQKSVDIQREMNVPIEWVRKMRRTLPTAARQELKDELRQRRSEWVNRQLQLMWSQRLLTSGSKT